MKLCCCVHTLHQIFIGLGLDLMTCASCAFLPLKSSTLVAGWQASAAVQRGQVGLQPAGGGQWQCGGAGSGSGPLPGLLSDQGGCAASPGSPPHQGTSGWMACVLACSLCWSGKQILNCCGAATGELCVASAQVNSYHEHSPPPPRGRFASRLLHKHKASKRLGHRSKQTALT